MQHPTSPDHRAADHGPASPAPSIIRTLAGLATLLIVTSLTACDNVSWGGAHFSVVAPPPGARSAAADDATTDEPVDEQTPTGPILYFVRAAGDQALLVPVAEIARDSLRPIAAAQNWELYGQRFIAQHLRQGTEFTLFHHGERAGTFVLQSAQIPGENVCPRPPRATGTLELTSNAREIGEFLALAKTYAPAGGRRQTATSLQPDRRIPLQASILAEHALRARGARLPNNWQRAMTDLRVFSTTGSADPAFAATFTVGDSTGREPNPAGYSIFLIAQPRPQVGYDTTYVEFIDFATSGRAVPRVVDYLDWSNSGGTGLLLEVTGTGETWFEAVGLENGRWRHLLRTRCEEPSAEVDQAVTDTVDNAGSAP